MEIGKIEGLCPYCGAENIQIGMGTAHLVSGDEKLLDYKVWTCSCHNCGAPIYNKKMEALNRVLTAEAFRSISEYMPLKEIRGMPAKYDISREDFCTVMGVPKTVMDGDDEVPFKLFDGDLPTPELEARLEDARNPKVWIEFLKLAENKISKSSFKKSMEKANAILAD